MEPLKTWLAIALAIFPGAGVSAQPGSTIVLVPSSTSPGTMTLAPAPPTTSSTTLAPSPTNLVPDARSGFLPRPLFDAIISGATKGQTLTGTYPLPSGVYTVTAVVKETFLPALEYTIGPQDGVPGVGPEERTIVASVTAKSDMMYLTEKWFDHGGDRSVGNISLGWTPTIPAAVSIATENVPVNLTAQPGAMTVQTVTSTVTTWPMTTAVTWFTTPAVTARGESQLPSSLGQQPDVAGVLATPVEYHVLIDESKSDYCTSYKDANTKGICSCTASHKKPMQITAVVPSASVASNMTWWSPATTTLQLTGAHWGTTDPKLTYFPLVSVPGGPPMSLKPPSSNKHFFTKPTCTDEKECYSHCYRHTYHKKASKHRAVKIGAGVGAAVGSALLAGLCCAGCCLCLPRLRDRARRRRDPKRKPTIVEPVTQPVTTAAPEVREVPATATTTALEPVDATDNRGTLGRQAEEGRGRPSVQFDEAPKAADEKATAVAQEGTEHVENVVQPTEEAVAPVEAVHDGATGHDIGSLRGRRRMRGEGL